MLNVKRRKGESIIISPVADLPPDMTVSELFADGDIQVYFHDTTSQHSSVGISAPEQLLILRDELVGRDI